MKEAKTETGLALYDEACKLDAGIVTPETEKTILALLEKAIACGCKEAFEMFGIYNLMGWGMYRPNYRKAGRFLEQASRRKSFSSYVDLAWCYYYGHGVPRRRRKAFALYLKAAMQGSELGMYNVGTFYEHGERCVVRKDPEKAVFGIGKRQPRGMQTPRSRSVMHMIWGKVSPRIKRLPSGGTDWRPRKGQVTRCGIFRRFMKRDWLSGEIVHMRQS